MDHIIKCPHCHGGIIVARDQINCQIFRHGVHKISGDQINQHACKQEADKLFQENAIFGCGKQFVFDGKKIEKCEGR